MHTIHNTVTRCKDFVIVVSICYSVVGPVVVKVSENSTVPPGSNLIITIEVTADPAPEVYWTLNSKKINISINFTTSQSDNFTAFENKSTSENFTASHPLTAQVNTTVSERRSFIIR